MPVISVQDEPAKPPRALTAQARRAIFTEPRVRQWWMLAVAVLVLFAVYTVERVLVRNDEVKLIRDGMIVTARLASAENRNKDQMTTPTDQVHLMLNLPTGVEEVTGYLTKQSLVGHDVSVRVDPGDHTRWTDRTEATPLLESLLVGIMVSPLVPVLFIMAYLKLRNMQKVWQTGTAQIAVISDRRQSPIAPMSYSLRCSLQNGNDKKLFDVFVPKAGKDLAEGGLIWVIVPVKKGSPLAGLWMGCGSVPV